MSEQTMERENGEFGLQDGKGGSDKGLDSEKYEVSRISWNTDRSAMLKWYSVACNMNTSKLLR
jgi:hypothetical protein